MNEKNTAALIGTITDSSVAQLTLELGELDKIRTQDPIYIYIYSPGGSVPATLMLIEFTKTMHRPIHTVSVVAMSCAFYLVQYMGTRYITESSVLLTHNAFFTHFEINDEQREIFDQSLIEINKIYSVIAARLGMSIDEYLSFMKAETPIKGENNIKLNTADKIVDIECSKQLLLRGYCPY